MPDRRTLVAGGGQSRKNQERGGRLRRSRQGDGETATFGALKITPRVCDTRPPTETPITAAFVEVDEVQLDKTEKRIFSGWMFAQYPGVHSVEHPVFDVWLTNCKMPIEGQSRGSSWKPAENP
jgi:hypothetical protein